MIKRMVTRAAVFLPLFILNAMSFTAFAQGSLTPPGAPGASMKTLSQIEPRTPISSLPYFITNAGSYYVTANLIGVSSSHGIIISSGNVAIDLNGFILQGVPGSGSGIYVFATYTNLTIRNGTVTGWGLAGVDAYDAAYPRSMLFENLTLSDNGTAGLSTEATSIVRDCLVYGNGADGIDCVGGEITHCISRNNGGHGFAASVMESGSGCVLRQCIAEYNSAGGFTLANSQALDCNSQYNYDTGFALASSRALDCQSTYNSTYGFDCTGAGNEFRRCRVSNNSSNGIVCEANATGMVIADCEIANNGGSGIYTTGGAGGGYIVQNNVSRNGYFGISLFDSNNYLEDNHVLTTNGSFGLNIGGTNNVVARNVVMGSGPFDFGVNPGNDVGPISTAASSTSPWANVGH